MSAKNTTVKNQPKKAQTIKPVKSFVEKNAMLLIILLLITGLVLRLYRLGYMSLWVDEYMHAMAAVKGKFSHGENNGILLTWLNTIFSSVIGHSEFALRLPVALAGAALIPVVYQLGKSVFNFRVGMMAAVLCTFSLYLIFWSRVDRPYGLVPLVYSLLLLFFWKALEGKPESAEGKLTIDKKFLMWTMLALILSMLSQLICFLFIFSAGFYGTFVSIDNWITKKRKPSQFDVYNLLFYLNLILIFMMFTPVGSKISIGILETFLPKNISQFILPDVNNIITTLKGENWDKAFNTYLGVLNNDFKFIAYCAWAGLLFSVLKNRKQAYFLISTFVVPFLLMSFVFTKLSHAKYLIFLYPAFLLSAAYGIYFFAYGVLKLIDKNMFSETSGKYAIVCNLAFLSLVYGTIRKDEMKTMLTTTKHGSLVNQNLAEISFVNWKQPCQYLNDNRKPKDIVMATVQVAPKYYLGLDTVIWFRQLHLNPKWNANSKTEEKYILNEPDNQANSAYTYDQLVKTYNNNNRGWLLADYYFDNALTDPRAKQFVEENFTYHFDASQDGGVKVFSWDKSKPKAYQSSFVIELGKNEHSTASMPLNFTMNPMNGVQKVNVAFLTQGIDSDYEAYLIINDKQIAIKSNGKPDKIETNVIEVPANYFVAGSNKVQFAYNDDEANGDMTKGFVIFNMVVR